MENVVINKSFWQGRTVLVTGHTGFKGGWLSLWLQSLGVKVVGYALAPSTSPSLFSLARIEEGMVSIIDDVTNGERLSSVVEKYNPEIIFHLAAQPLVHVSYASPATTYMTNVMGTVHLFEAARRNPIVRAIINVTSDKCYKNIGSPHAFDEADELGGYDPYSTSKACAELVSTSYVNSFFNPDHYETHRLAVATARAGNVIGGGDWGERRLIPDILESLKTHAILKIRQPDSTRPWQHVLNVIYGYLLLAQKLYEKGKAYVGPWNFGPPQAEAIPVRCVVQRLLELWNDMDHCVELTECSQHEAKYLSLNSAKARDRLGWHPSCKFDKALELVVAWHKAYIAGDDMRQFTLDQIITYQNT